MKGNEQNPQQFQQLISKAFYEKEAIKPRKEVKKKMPKLTKSQAQLAEIIKENLNKGYLWEKTWKVYNGPSNADGTPYEGLNFTLLSLLTIKNHYRSNRWYTFAYMQSHGLTFKKDDKGQSLAKHSGAYIDYYNIWDKNTKKPFNRHDIEDLTEEEQKEYLKQFVYCFNSPAVVFNGDLIEGLPEIDEVKTNQDPNHNKKVEAFINKWSDKEVKIYYGGNKSCYIPSADIIQLPEVRNFKNNASYYQVALHEIAHSTGAAKRINRNLMGHFGDVGYAKEELIAEFSSLFLCQHFGAVFDGGNDALIKNTAAYLDSWRQVAGKNEEEIIKAIQGAAKVEKYIKEWEARN